MSDNKDIDVSSSKNAAADTKPQLPEKAYQLLKMGLNDGYKNGRLNLASIMNSDMITNRGINDKMVPELCEWIVKLADKIKELILANNEISSTGAIIIFDTLKTNKSSIRGVSLSGNRFLVDSCLKSLGEFVKNSNYIEYISISRSAISDKGITLIAPYLDGNLPLRRLDVSGCQGLTDESKLLLIKMIESSHIEQLLVHDTLISDKNCVLIPLAHNMIKYGSRNMEFSQQNVTDGDMIKICDAMKTYGIDKLKTVDLHHNNITSKGASVLFDTLKECNSAVIKLSLSSNQLDDECMKQLGEYIQDNDHLKELLLGENNITDKGIKVLSEYLIGNEALKLLDLFGNEQITDESFPHILEIAKKSCIDEIDTWDTSLSDEKREEIKDLLSAPIDEREIPVKSNTKSAAKISAST